ncbi:XRE family transcriptional regulator [Streptomyces capitiformicae]|uniref:XRE family transcriptional regulator n=1 Tax=Streptomyces capitiformicae TaxID=2014920 RepID=A0A918YZC3_9ACTN|nr:XRE family transcriptional regulator [Streptomyces capitiformicae]
MAAPSGSGQRPVSSTAAAVGAKIRLRRRQRGMSAAEIARRAGLSKATLSQMEAGKGNPTIGTLDAIAVALRIPIADLPARDADTGPVYRPGNPAEPGEVARDLLRRISLENWRLRIPPETELTGVPHATGTIEHLLIAAGHVTAWPVDAPQDLGPGDMLAFAGDVPHFYRTAAEAVDITGVFASPIGT